VTSFENHTALADHENANWPNLKIAPINYQEIIFPMLLPARGKSYNVDDIDPELEETFDKLVYLLRNKSIFRGGS